MASAEGSNGDDWGEIGNAAGTNMDYTDMETSLKLEKSRAKSTFTRLKNKLIFLVESEGIGTSREVQEACDNLDNSLERTMNVMT